MSGITSPLPYLEVGCGHGACLVNEMQEAATGISAPDENLVFSLPYFLPLAAVSLEIQFRQNPH